VDPLGLFDGGMSLSKAKLVIGDETVGGYIGSRYTDCASVALLHILAINMLTHIQ
jgi:hypothetical protein